MIAINQKTNRYEEVNEDTDYRAMIRYQACIKLYDDYVKIGMKPLDAYVYAINLAPPPIEFSNLRC